MDDASYNSPYVLKYNDIKQAAEIIEGGIIHTPLCESKLSKFMDYDIYLKCENLQYTGSCAERGIRNAFVATADDILERGVIVPSSGNMAMSAAYHGGLLGVPVTVVIPERTPPAYAQHCSELGADVVLCGNTYEDAYAYAKKVHTDSKQMLISSDHPLVMAGMGTVGVEIVMQLPEADAVIVPVAGGGLLAGVLVATKKLKCSTLVYVKD